MMTRRIAGGSVPTQKMSELFPKFAGAYHNRSRIVLVVVVMVGVSALEMLCLNYCPLSCCVMSSNCSHKRYVLS